MATKRHIKNDSGSFLQPVGILVHKILLFYMYTYIQPENHVQMHYHGVVCTKIYTCLHRKKKRRSLFLLCERGVNSSVDSQVWVSIGVFYTARHVLHLSSVRMFTVLSPGFRMLRLLRAVFLGPIQLLARHPDAIDVFKFHHALGEVWGCDVESLLGDVTHCLVNRDSVVRVVAVDVQMSRKTCQRQGHIGHLIELGLEGHVETALGEKVPKPYSPETKQGSVWGFPVIAIAMTYFIHPQNSAQSFQLLVRVTSFCLFFPLLYCSL